jgi:hypothetical protein
MAIAVNAGGQHLSARHTRRRLYDARASTLERRALSRPCSLRSVRPGRVSMQPAMPVSVQVCQHSRNCCLQITLGRCKEQVTRTTAVARAEVANTQKCS